MAFQLRVGFDESVPEDRAVAEAVQEWREACEREGREPAGDPTTQVVRDDPDRAAMGEYAVVVTGVRRGDQ